MGIRYQQPATFNASIGQERKDWMIARAVEISESTKINPNASAVICEAIDCYQEVLELFGENWREHLQVQSQPKWASEILEKLDNLKVVSKPEQVETINKMAMEISGDMLE